MTTRARARPSSGRFKRGSAPQRAWFNQQSSPATVLSSGQAIFNLTPTANIPGGLRGSFTAMRLIGHVSMYQDTANVTCLGMFGVAVVTLDALVAGAVPDPSVDLVDWWYHDAWFFDDNPIISHRFVFDIHTARKVRGEDRTLAFVIDNNSVATGIVFSVYTRLLLQG